MLTKVARTVTGFSAEPSTAIFNTVSDIRARLEKSGYEVQTQRVCSNGTSMSELATIASATDDDFLISVGTISRENAQEQIQQFFEIPNVSFNLEVGSDLKAADIDFLYRIIEQAPHKCFNFAYVFNNAAGSPYFPSASYVEDGYAIGLQSTDLAADCHTLAEWFSNQKAVWQELLDLFGQDISFLGIDSSVAPIFNGPSSLVSFINQLAPSFSAAVTTPLFTEISAFIKSANPKPVGLCGLMFPCLEDFELAAEYEQGNFSLERNIFLSLHSGLGIDTYPLGVDQAPSKVYDTLQLMQALSNKYDKPLSVRFISDGKSKIGERTTFNNKYLTDVTIQPL